MIGHNKPHAEIFHGNNRSQFLADPFLIKSGSLMYLSGKTKQNNAAPCKACKPLKFRVMIIFVHRQAKATSSTNGFLENTMLHSH